MTFGTTGPDPIRLSDFYAPLKLFAYTSVFIPTLACSIVFDFASVLMTVEIPEIFGSKFDFNPQQIGLQFLGLIVRYVCVVDQCNGFADWSDGALLSASRLAVRSLTSS
jgi:hypothetical protein